MTCRHPEAMYFEEDYGVCPETGYHDGEIGYRCVECGETFSEREWAELMREREEDGAAEAADHELTVLIEEGVH